MQTKHLNKYLYLALISWCMFPSEINSKVEYPFKKKQRLQGLLTSNNTHESRQPQDLSSQIDAIEPAKRKPVSAAVPAHTSPRNTTVVIPPSADGKIASNDSTTNKPITSNQKRNQQVKVVADENLKNSVEVPTEISVESDTPSKKKPEKKDEIIKNRVTSDVKTLLETSSHPGEKTITVSANKFEETLDSLVDEVPSIEFQFENADLQNLVTQVGDIFHVTFIPEDAITVTPAPTPAKPTIKGNKISFKTQRPLTKKDAWNLFLSFLDLAGFALVPQADPTFFKITSIDTAQHSSVRSFIGVDPKLLPDNDETIRYVYYIENSTTDAIQKIVDALRSSTALFQMLLESKAFILTDKSYNIKALMQIVKELDKISLPQTLSVLKLKRADATQVKTLYETITKTDDASITSRLFPNRKQPTTLYFPENTRIFAEPRTNTLILLGPKDAIAKIEDFIIKHIDVDIDKPYTPLQVYHLKYADAFTVSEILKQVTAFGQQSEAGKNAALFGGVRGGDKFLKSMSFTPDKDTNSLVIRGEYDDYLQVVDIIKKLDEPQPQVAVEVLILTLSLLDQKTLGTQLRSAIPGIEGLVGPNVKFQTSGFIGSGGASGVVENPNGVGVTRLLGNLVSLAQGAVAGTTVITLGNDAYGVWGIFQALKSIANTQVVANPFLTATNKTPANVTLGQTRRVQNATTISGGVQTSGFTDDSANLSVKIVPQINSDGMIRLDLDISNDQFLDTNQSSGHKQTRTITTSAIVADKEVLALGGLMQNTINDNSTSVPILGDIPILGWLFKNKQKNAARNNLLVLISTRIIRPESDIIRPYTEERIADYRHSLDQMVSPSDRHDPVNKLFFAAGDASIETQMENFLFQRQGDHVPQPERKMSRNQRRKLARKEKRLAKNRETPQGQQVVI